MKLSIKRVALLVICFFVATFSLLGRICKEDKPFLPKIKRNVSVEYVGRISNRNKPLVIEISEGEGMSTERNLICCQKYDISFMKLKVNRLKKPNRVFMVLKRLSLLISTLKEGIHDSLLFIQSNLNLKCSESNSGKQRDLFELLGVEGKEKCGFFLKSESLLESFNISLFNLKDKDCRKKFLGWQIARESLREKEVKESEFEDFLREELGTKSDILDHSSLSSFSQKKPDFPK